MIAGAEDHMTRLNPAASGVGFEQMRALRADAEIVLLPECGHYLVIEQPEGAGELIVEFLNRC
jgi:pimeloyl-ACP methyl ester carboxylesterase